MKYFVSFCKKKNDPSLLNALDENGQAPLHIAAKYIHKARVTILLLRHGADPAITNSDGMMPIHLAAQFKNYSLFILYVTLGMKFNAPCLDQRLKLYFSNPIPPRIPDAILDKNEQLWKQMLLGETWNWISIFFKKRNQLLAYDFQIEGFQPILKLLLSPIPDKILRTFYRNSDLVYGATCFTINGLGLYRLDKNSSCEKHICVASSANDDRLHSEKICLILYAHASFLPTGPRLAAPPISAALPPSPPSRRGDEFDDHSLEMTSLSSSIGGAAAGELSNF